MKAYLGVFVNFKQNNWARFLSIAKFAYNNSKNVSTKYRPFKLNYGYYFYTSYKEDNDFYFKLKIDDELLSELQ